MNKQVEAELQELHARVCKAIADPKRLLIINELRNSELSVGELCEALGLSQSNASQHLAVLRHAGLVTSRRDGNRVLYSITDEHFLAMCEHVCASIERQNEELGAALAGLTT